MCAIVTAMIRGEHIKMCVLQYNIMPAVNTLFYSECVAHSTGENEWAQHE